MKPIFLTFCFTLMILFFHSCSINSDYQMATRSVMQAQYLNGFPKQGIKFYGKIRNRLEAVTSLDSFIFDSIYMIESFCFEDGRTYGTVIAGRRTWNYSYFKGDFNFFKESYFPKTMLNRLLSEKTECDTTISNIVYPTQPVVLTMAKKGERGRFVVNSIICDMHD